ncbi:MAG TPA: helix-turn-helix domain-containing protein, partial [Armatimonadota bacterium]
MHDGQTGTRKRRTAAERRAEIMQAAIALFARQGFERTTTKEIAAAAGISEGTIYKYFTTKQEILLSFLDSEIMSVV